MSKNILEKRFYYKLFGIFLGNWFLFSKINKKIAPLGETFFLQQVMNLKTLTCLCDKTLSKRKVKKFSKQKFGHAPKI